LRIEGAFKARDLVAQREAPLLEAPQQQLVARNGVSKPVNGGVEVGVLDPKLDQLARNRVKIGVQRAQFTNGAISRLFRGLRSLDNTSSFSSHENMRDRAIGASAPT
jgi:hypothetical protein